MRDTSRSLVPLLTVFLLCMRQRLKDASESYICIAEQATGSPFSIPAAREWNMTRSTLSTAATGSKIYAVMEPERPGFGAIMAKFAKVGREDNRGKFHLLPQAFDEHGERPVC